MYSPDVNGIVLRTDMEPQALELQSRKEGWANVELRQKSILRHEYTHLIWDELPLAVRKQIIEAFVASDTLKQTREFGATLISKTGYTRHEDDFSVAGPDIEYQYGNPPVAHKYPAELIVNELFAHASLSELVSRDETGKINPDNDRAGDFARRSKSAVDAINAIKVTNPVAYALFEETGLVNNKQFDADYKVIAKEAQALANR